MFRTTLAVVATTASLALATNAHAFGQIPSNGRSLSGCQDEGICGTDYSAGGQGSVHPDALFDDNGISPGSAAEGMKLESGDDSSIARPTVVSVTDEVAYISLNGPSLNGLSFTRQRLVQRVHQHGCQRVRSYTCL